MDALRHFNAFQIREDYRRPVIPLLIVFTAGLLCGERIFLPVLLSGGIIGICLAVLFKRIVHRQTALFIPPALFFFLGWHVMTGFSFPSFPAGHVTRFAGETRWTITGRIIDEPASGPGRRIFFVKPQFLEHGRRLIRTAGNLRVTIYGNNGPELACGAMIHFQSRIIPITNFENPGRFDYKRYMAFQKVFGLAYTDADRVEVVSANAISGLRSMVASVRKDIEKQIEKSGNGVRIGILKALIIGDKRDLDPDVREAFARAGVSHLLAISGLHMGIVAGLIFFALARIFAFFPFLTGPGWVKKTAALFTLPGVVFYGLLAGMSPSTQRAVIMTTVFLMALVAGRRHQLINSLALAALVILAVHPPSLFAVSFQLSFAAVFFIVLGMDAVEGFLNGLKNRWLKRSAAFILVSFFAIAGTSPLTAHYFNQVSWIGLFTNCFMIPLVGFAALPLGLAGAAINGLFPDLSMMFFKAGGGILSLAFNIIEKIAALPHVSVKTVTPGLIETGSCYALLLAGIMAVKHKRFFFPKDPESRPPTMPVALKIALSLAAVAVIILIVDAGYWVNRRFLHDDLRVTALDVGQGNAALVELPGGKCMLIDGGGFTGSSTFDVGKMIVAPFLWRNKIGTVDTVILTHPDTDHLGGLVYIAEHFHVKVVWSTGETVETEPFHRFMRVVQKNQITMIKNTRAAKERVINGVRIETLYPPRGFPDRKKVQPWRNTNNNSLVTRFVLGDISFLFPGDIEAEGERELAVLSEENLASTVLMAPHHGSRTSSTAFFLSMIKPEVVVVSTGRHNRFGCPCPDVLDRYAALGAGIFRTDLDGAVIMSTNGKSLRVTTPMAEE